MAREPKQRRQVVQAQRFADSLTYNAYTALSRARHLRRDAEELEALLKKEEAEEDPPLRDWFGLEIVSYYLVGFVTCLEWHARTRLADLLTFQPDAIDKGLLDGKVSPELLAQMIRARVTIPHLLSASITVGNIDEYMEILQRVLDALGIEKKVSSIIQPEPLYSQDIFGEPWTEPSVYKRLSNLFEARHSLVHEIGLSRMSSPAISENWDTHQIFVVGRLVEATIQAFEATLSELAPANFPNLMNKQYYPVDEGKRLSEALSEVMNRISAKIDTIRSSRGIDERGAWQEVLEGHYALGGFIARSDLFRARYTDPRQAILRLELESRLKVFEALESAIGNPGIIEEE